LKWRQEELWRKATVHKNTVAAKLRLESYTEEADCLENCHTYYTVAQCGDCGAVRKFPNRCDRFYCPECAHHLQREREKQVAWWTRECKQPKHVVLTVKNIPHLTFLHVQEFRGWFTKLRRLKFARNWVGGFYRIEVTNEGKGWHLHLHALVEAKWIDQPQLKNVWRRLTNGLGYIVKVMDVRQGSYLHEVTKYVVKGHQLASWQPADIVTFLNAFQNVRTFGVFGSLYGKRTEFAEWLASIKSSRPKCECGSCNVRYFNELDWLAMDCRPTLPVRERPPPDLQRELLPNVLQVHCPPS
jgi:hypothetical protein